MGQDVASLRIQNEAPFGKCFAVQAGQIEIVSSGIHCRPSAAALCEGVHVLRLHDGSVVRDGHIEKEILNEI